MKPTEVWSTGTQEKQVEFNPDGIHVCPQLSPLVSRPQPPQSEGRDHSPGVLTAMAHQWRSLHTAYASINTLNRKTAKSCIKKKRQDKF